MLLVYAHHRRLVLMLVRQRHFDALRIVDHMVVREDVPLLVQHKPRALPLLRHRPVEEVERHRR